MEKLTTSQDVESQVDLSRCLESDSSIMHVMLKQLFQINLQKDRHFDGEEGSNLFVLDWILIIHFLMNMIVTLQ